jgi:hypothetical protein
MTYFSNYPLIRYNNKISLNLLLRAKIISDVLDRYQVYYPYVIKDSETADFLAYKFYRDPELDWVIYYSNNMIDPIHEWPMSTNDLERFIEKKYNKRSFETKNDILHYEYTGLDSETPEDIARKRYTMAAVTYSFLSTEERSGWTPVYVYDYEFNKNESKRNIRLLDSSYISQIKSELAKIFDD